MRYNESPKNTTTDCRCFASHARTVCILLKHPQATTRQYGEFVHTKARRTSGGVSVSENTLYCKTPELRNYVWNIPIALLFDRRQGISAAATNAQRLDSLNHQYRASWTLPDVLYVIEKHHAVLFSYFEYSGGDQTAGLGLPRLHNVGLPTPEVPCFWSS